MYLFIKLLKYLNSFIFQLLFYFNTKYFFIILLLFIIIFPLNLF